MIPPDLDLKKLPAKPVIDGANYDWTGRLGDYPCLLNGHVELEGVRRGLIGDLQRLGLVDPQIGLTRVDAIERVVSGKLRRFVPLLHPTRVHHVFKENSR